MILQPFFFERYEASRERRFVDGVVPGILPSVRVAAR